MENQDIHILIIEDEPMVRDSYIDMLACLNFEADTAINGKDGLLKLSRQPYDIILTDLNMPVMDGLETLKRIKKQYAHTEVIVITGFATIENAITAMKHGAFDYITKPISMEHVKIVLRRCINHIKATRENEELKNVNSRLTEINELKNKFITITNHEMRTPLAVLKGYFELVYIELDEKNPDVEEYLNIISGTLNELINMLERMHNLSNFEKSLHINNRELFNPLELLESIAGEMRVLFGKREIDFHTQFKVDDVFIFGSKSDLRIAIRELLQNALKFTDKGGKVSLHVKKEIIHKKLYIYIEDSGIGIPTEKLGLIFEPFYEVQDVMHHSTSQTEFMGGGIGVGLSLVNEIVESFKGEVDVDSNPGNGSVFTMILPYTEKNNNMN